VDHGRFGLSCQHGTAAPKSVTVRKFGLTPEEAEEVIQAVGVKELKKKPRRRKAGTT